ncbi:unnamed protein product, partial [Prorocentrum cordatum]
AISFFRAVYVSPAVFKGSACHGVPGETVEFVGCAAGNEDVTSWPTGFRAYSARVDRRLKGVFDLQALEELGKRSAAEVSNAALPSFTVGERNVPEAIVSLPLTAAPAKCVKAMLPLRDDSVKWVPARTQCYKK